jgi:hypothetical protein
MVHKKDAAGATTAPLSALGVTKGWVLTTFKRDRYELFSISVYVEVATRKN